MEAPRASDWLRSEQRFLQEAVSRASTAMQTGSDTLRECQERLRRLERENTELRENVEKLKVEVMAAVVYGELPYDGPKGTTRPAWVPFGNALKQDEARSIARERNSR